MEVDTARRVVDVRGLHRRRDRGGGGPATRPVDPDQVRELAPYRLTQVPRSGPGGRCTLPRAYFGRSCRAAASTAATMPTGSSSTSCAASAFTTFADLRPDDDDARRSAATDWWSPPPTSRPVSCGCPGTTGASYGLDPDRQPVADAVRASMSILFIFPAGQPDLYRGLAPRRWSTAGWLPESIRSTCWTARQAPPAGPASAPRVTNPLEGNDRVIPALPHWPVRWSASAWEQITTFWWAAPGSPGTSPVSTRTIRVDLPPRSGA